MKNDLNFLLNKKDVTTDSGEQNYIFEEPLWGIITNCQFLTTNYI